MSLMAGCSKHSTWSMVVAFLCVNVLPGAAGAAVATPASTGTGFVVSAEGNVLTNHHVVDGCSSIQTTIAGMRTELTLLGFDTTNDLALLKLSGPRQHVAHFRDGRNIRTGEGIVVVGFPLHRLLAAEANVTAGVVSALAGLGNDIRFLQMTAPVQPGSSGGPVLDQGGNIVGVVVGKLDALELAKATGDIPQNVNFAISAAVAKTFLDSQGVNYETSKSSMKMETADIASAAKQFTLVLECHHAKLDGSLQALESQRRAIEVERGALEAERKALEKERRDWDEKQKAIDAAKTQPFEIESRQLERRVGPGQKEPSPADSNAHQPNPRLNIKGVGETGDPYFLRLQQLVAARWEGSDVELVRGSIVVALRIESKGAITNVEFKQLSGNTFADMATLRAVIDAHPLPPLPARLSGPFYDIECTFQPNGKSHQHAEGVSSVIAYYNLAFNDYLVGRYDMAVVQFQQLLADFPAYPQAASALHWLGESYFQLRDYRRATKALELVVVKYPESVDMSSILYRIALCSLEMGDPEKAKRFLEKVIGSFPTSAEASLARTKLSQLPQ